MGSRFTGDVQCYPAVRQQTGFPSRTVVNTMYVDFGLIPFLERNGVTIDKLAYHYYPKFNSSP